MDWAIYGVPFDGGVTFRPGARFGPRAVRDASQYVKAYHLEHRVNVAATLSMADAGDAPVSPYDLKGTLDGAAAWAARLGTPGTTRLLAVGGDHSVAYANLRATWEARGKPEGGLALVHFDSHLDTVDTVWGERWGHASPFIRAIEEGIVNPRRMISIGIKGPMNTDADFEFPLMSGVSIVTYADWRREGAERIEQYVSRTADHPAYISFDVDVVDPAFAPGTGTPSVGGLTSADALELLRGLKGLNVVGGDVVEVLPDRDVSDMTALLAAHVVFEIVSLDAARRAMPHLA